MTPGKSSGILIGFLTSFLKDHGTHAHSNSSGFHWASVLLSKCYASYCVSGEQDGGQELMTGAGELAQGLRVLVLAKNPNTHTLANNHL